MSARALRRHERAAREEEPPPGSEADHLRDVLRRCGLDEGFVVDIAAGDGVDRSSTLFLFRDPAWRGLAVEMDARRFRRLDFAYRGFGGVRTVRHEVTPGSVVPLLSEMEVPEEFEVLNLDIDSWDLRVAEALLRAFRPVVITMEVNEKIPPPVYFAVDYHPGHVWAEDHFYGCSIVAASELLATRGYVLESLHYNNAFFVRGDMARDRIPPRGIAEAYRRGYVDRGDRLERFPWNRELEAWLHMPPDEVVQALRRRFAAYEGGFTVGVRPGPTAPGRPADPGRPPGRRGRSGRDRR